MRGITTAIVLILSGFAHSVSAAGLAYTVTIKRSGEMDRLQTFTVIASEDRLRVSHIDAAEGAGVLYDGLIKNASGIVALNSRNRTWYSAPALSPFALTSRYLSPTPDGKVKKLSMTIHPGAAPAGEHHYSGEIRYDVQTSLGGHPVKVSCMGAFTVTTTDNIPRQHWLGRILPETGYGDVDAQLRSAEGQIEGFPTRLSLHVMRTYAGGAPMFDSIVVTVSGIREMSPAESEFVRPADYRFQEPVVAAPGVTRRD